MSAGDLGERVEALFHAACEVNQADRPAYVKSQCGDDRELFDEVERLLAAETEADDFFARPGVDLLIASELAKEELQGVRLDGYEIRRVIGTGGMGSVYEAVQEHPRRTVALKLMHAVGPELERRFHSEAELLARLSHPYVATVFGAGVLDVAGRRVPFIAMELVPGARPIGAYARENELDRSARIELVAQVCEAVYHGHQHGVVHRDLKPANILIARDGSPRLIDFGIARALDVDGTRSTSAGDLLGTVSYMSPEQCTDAATVDVRGDVYSLGVILYELLCDQLPYEIRGLPLPEATRVIQECEARPPSSIDPSLRGDIETILMCALENDRTRRFDTVEELRFDLLRALRGEPIASRPPGLLRQVAMLARRYRAATTVLGVVLLLSIVVAASSSWFALQVDAARLVQRRLAARAHLAAADASLRVHDTTAAIGNLDAVPVDLRGWEWGHLRGLLDMERLVIESPGGQCTAVAWLRGREQCVSGWFGTGVGSLALSNTVTGERIAVVEFQNPPLDIDVSPDKDRLLLTVQDALVLFEHDLGREVWRVPSDAGAFLAADFDESGTYVVAVTDQGQIRIIDARSAVERARTRIDSGSALRAVAFGPGAGRLVAAGDGQALLVFDRALQHSPVVLEGHTDAVLALATCDGSARIASGSRDGTVRIWDAESGQELQRLHGHRGEVVDCALLEDCDRLVSAATDGTIRTWNLVSGEETGVLSGHRTWISAISLSPDETAVVAGALDGTLRFLDAEPFQASRVLTSHDALVRDLAFAPDGTRVVSCSFDRTVRVTSLTGDMESTSLTGHERRVGCVAWQPSGDVIASGSNDRTVRIWDAQTWEPIALLDGFEGAVHSLVFHPNGGELAIGTISGEVLVFATADWTELRAFDQGSGVQQLAWSPNGELLAAALEQGLRVFDATSGALVFEETSEDWILSVAFHPDGRRVVTGGSEVIVRDVASGRIEARLRAPSGASDLAFHPSGSPLAIASSNGVVRLWDQVSAEPILTLRGHRSWVFAVAFSPDGTRLASAGGNYDDIDPSVRIWESRPRAPAPRLVTQSMSDADE